MLHTMDVVTAAGLPFRVVFIPAVDAGPNPYRHPADNREATVEIYDRRHHSTDRPGDGQFTGGSYYASTLLNTGGLDTSRRSLADSGLNVHGGVPDWFIDGATMSIVLVWIWDLVAKERVGLV